jgi:site-specific DNA-cytosine methylase
LGDEVHCPYCHKHVHITAINYNTWHANGKIVVKEIKEEIPAEEQEPAVDLSQYNIPPNFVNNNSSQESMLHKATMEFGTQGKILDLDDVGNTITDKHGDSDMVLIDDPEISEDGIEYVGYVKGTKRKKGSSENPDLSRNQHQPNRIYGLDGVSPSVTNDCERLKFADIVLKNQSGVEQSQSPFQEIDEPSRTIRTVVPELTTREEKDKWEATKDQRRERNKITLMDREKKNTSWSPTYDGDARPSRVITNRPQHLIEGDVAADPSKDSKQNVIGKLRRLTVRECARLQSFDDGFIFIGSKSACFRMVGNAVPPLIAQRLAEMILKEKEEGGSVSS